MMMVVILMIMVGVVVVVIVKVMMVLIGRKTGNDGDGGCLASVKNCFLK